MTKERIAEELRRAEGEIVALKKWARKLVRSRRAAHLPLATRQRIEELQGAASAYRAMLEGGNNGKNV